MASTIRTMTLNVGMLTVPVALKTASERKLPTFSTASPEGHKYERYHGPAIVEADKPKPKVISTEEPTPVDAPQEAQYVDVATGVVFQENEIKTGVWDGDTFYPIAKSQIEEIDALTRVEGIDIERFVPLKDVPWERVKNAYYLAPDKGVGLKTLALLRDALAKTKTAGVFLLMPKSRVALAVVYAKHDGLFVSVLGFAEEFAQVKEGAAALAKAEKRDPNLLAMAVELIQTMSEPDAGFIEQYEDVQANMKVDLIEKAKTGAPLTDGEAAGGKATTLGDDAMLQALKDSVAAAKPKSRANGSSEKTRATSRV